jgi:hypothetical protein
MPGGDRPIRRPEPGGSDEPRCTSEPRTARSRRGTHHAARTAACPACPQTTVCGGSLGRFSHAGRTGTFPVRDASHHASRTFFWRGGRRGMHRRPRIHFKAGHPPHWPKKRASFQSWTPTTLAEKTGLATLIWWVSTIAHGPRHPDLVGVHNCPRASPPRFGGCPQLPPRGGCPQ